MISESIPSGHQNFYKLEYDETLKFSLYLDYTKVSLLYTRDSDRKPRVILDQGELVVPMDSTLDGRLSVVGAVVNLKRAHVSDIGLFRVKDLLGFHIADIHLAVHRE